MDAETIATVAYI